MREEEEGQSRDAGRRRDQAKEGDAGRRRASRWRRRRRRRDAGEEERGGMAELDLQNKCADARREVRRVVGRWAIQNRSELS